MKQHKKLLEGLLLKESFELLRQEMTNADDLKRVEIFKEYSDLYTSISIFNRFVETNNMIDYVKYYVNEVRTNPLLESVRDRLNIFVSEAKLDLLFAGCIYDKNYDGLKFLLPYVTKDITQYPNAMSKTIQSQDEEMIRFLITNMTNTHYHNDLLLSEVSEVSNDLLRYMIEERGFNVNAVNEITNTNLVSFVAYAGRLDVMRFLVNNFNDVIDWKQTVPEYVEEKDLSRGYIPKENALINRCLEIFAENSESSLIEFYKILLNGSVSLHSGEVMSLVLFAKNHKTVFLNHAYVLKELFSHKNLHMDEYPETNGSLVYDLISEFSNEVFSSNVKHNMREIVGFTKIYLSTIDEKDEIRASKHYHPLGAALYIHQLCHFDKLKIISSKRDDVFIFLPLLVEEFIKAFSNDVNYINPNGLLPIQLVTEGEPEYIKLIASGALPVSEEPNLFGSLMNKLKNKKIYTVKEVVALEAARRNQLERGKSREKIKTDLRDILESLQDSFSEKFKELIARSDKERSAPVIINVLREFDTKSQKIIDLMLRQNYMEKSNELQWLRGNFISYLEEALNSYWRLLDVARNSSSGEELNEKITSAQDRVLINMKKIQNQLNIVIKNIASEIEYLASSDMNLGGRFISDTFDIEEKQLNQRMIRSHEMEEKGLKNESTVFDDSSVDIMSYTSDKKEVSNTEKGEAKDVSNKVKTAVDDLFN